MAPRRYSCFVVKNNLQIKYKEDTNYVNARNTAHASKKNTGLIQTTPTTSACFVQWAALHHVWCVGCLYRHANEYAPQPYSPTALDITLPALPPPTPLPNNWKPLQLHQPPHQHYTKLAHLNMQEIMVLQYLILLLVCPKYIYFCIITFIIALVF